MATTVSNNLMRAILSMDSYNRGYDTAFNSNFNAITLGDLTLARETIDPGSRAIGFYASAFTNGTETIIAIRGTDDKVNINLGDTH